MVIYMAEKKASNSTETLTYKGKPLIRSGNIIFLGDMKDKFVIMLQIMETANINDMEMATKVSVSLQLSDPEIRARDRVVKKTEKDGLYSALDIGSIWLERALKEN